jgi:hypothetical protein
MEDDELIARLASGDDPAEAALARADLKAAETAAGTGPGNGGGTL